MDIPQHRHCRLCGKAIPLNEDFCSGECKEKYMSFLRKRRRLFYIMYAVLFGMFLVIVALLYYP